MNINSTSSFLGNDKEVTMNSVIYAMEMLQEEMKEEADKADIKTEEDVNNIVKELRRNKAICTDGKISISEQLIPYIFTMPDGESMTDKVNLAAILGLLATDLLTFERAVELSGKSVQDFLEILKKYDIIWNKYIDIEVQ